MYQIENPIGKAMSGMSKAANSFWGMTKNIPGPKKPEPTAGGAIMSGMGGAAMGAQVGSLMGAGGAAAAGAAAGSVVPVWGTRNRGRCWPWCLSFILTDEHNPGP